VEEPDQAPPSAGGHELASEVGERVRSIISAAEAAANAVRHEAEQTAAIRRRVAEEEARRIIEDAKSDADAYLAERVRRISELSDTLIERAETIVARLDRAEEVRRQLQSLADALGESAEKLASDVRVDPPQPAVRGTETAPPPSGSPVEEPAVEDAVTQAIPAAEPAAEDAVTQAIPAAEAQPAAEAEASVPADPLADAAPPASADVVPEPAGPAEDPAAAEASDVVRLDGREAPVGGDQAARGRREADDQLGARLVALQMAVAGGARGEVEVHLRRTFDLTDPSSILDDVFGRGTEPGKRVAWPRTGDPAA
jgi:hypothetical protein